MNTKFKLNLHKSYFEKGYSLTFFIKYLIALFGLSSLDVSKTMTYALIWAVGCYFLGWFWYNFGWYEEEIEVSNYFNKFVKEMRNTYSAKRKTL